MKYKLLKPLPWIEVGTIFDDERDINLSITMDLLRLDSFVKAFWTDNDFFEYVEEKYWIPRPSDICYDLYGDIFNQWIMWVLAWLAFKTKEEAEKQLRLMQAITRCRKYLVDNDFLITDNILFNHRFTVSKIRQWIFLVEWHSLNVVYSPYWYINSKENADKFIKDCEKDLKIIHLPI